MNPKLSNKRTGLRAFSRIRISDTGFVKMQFKNVEFLLLDDKRDVRRMLTGAACAGDDESVTAGRN